MLEATLGHTRHERSCVCVVGETTVGKGWGMGLIRKREIFIMYMYGMVREFYKELG